MRSLIALALCLAATPAVADFLTGNDLQATCPAKAGSDAHGVCRGYAMAIADMLSLISQDFPNGRVCIPEGVQSAQAVAVISKFLNDHPERLHQPATWLLWDAFKAAFPCK